jgi:hypothetical protein
MRRLSAVLAASLAACDPTPPDVTLRTGMTVKEYNEPPSPHRVKAAILQDVRRDRMLHLQLEKGSRQSPASILHVNAETVCAADKSPLEYYSLKSDPPDQPHRVDESAFFCREEFVYYYHYVGGARRLDVWMGPFKLDRKFPKLEGEMEK